MEIVGIYPLSAASTFLWTSGLTSLIFFTVPLAGKAQAVFSPAHKLFSPSPSHGPAGESRMLLAEITAGASRNICLCTAGSLQSKIMTPGKPCAGDREL